MNSFKNKLSTFALYFLAFTLALYFLYEYLVIAYYAIAIIVLFFIGLPTKGWFNNINKPMLFASQLAVVTVFIIKVLT